MPALPNDLSTLHPRTRRLLEHWQGLCREERLPGHAELELTRVDDLLPDIWLVEFVGPAKRVRIRQVGARVERIVGMRLAGRWTDDLFDTRHNRPTDPGSRDHTLVARREPYFYRGPPRYFFPPGVAGLEMLDLPLASDGSEVDMAVSISLFLDAEGRLYDRSPTGAS